MTCEENIVETLEGRGRMGLVELAGLFLISPPAGVWEEEFDGEECDWEDEEKWSKCKLRNVQYVDG